MNGFEKETYSTLKFIDDLSIEIGKFITKKELWRGRLSYNKLSILLGFREEYLQDIRKRLLYPNKKDYNPNYLKRMLQNFPYKEKPKIYLCSLLLLSLLRLSSKTLNLCPLEILYSLHHHNIQFLHLDNSNLQFQNQHL